MSKEKTNGKSSRWFRIADEPRDWEDFYRERWSFDKSVRTSHGVNCSGSCSWEVFVKDGLICWELQKTDWPQIDSNTPNYEPRGCQRGISSSWYPYSPVRPNFAACCVRATSSLGSRLPAYPSNTFVVLTLCSTLSLVIRYPEFEHSDYALAPSASMFVFPENIKVQKNYSAPKYSFFVSFYA